MTAPGTLLPAMSLVSIASGEPVDLRAAKGPQALVTLHSVTCRDCRRYVRERLARGAREIAEWGGRLTIVVPDVRANAATFAETTTDALEIVLDPEGAFGSKCPSWPTPARDTISRLRKRSWSGSAFSRSSAPSAKARKGNGERLSYRGRDQAARRQRNATAAVASITAPDEGIASQRRDSFAAPVLPSPGARKPAHIQNTE